MEIPSLKEKKDKKKKKKTKSVEKSTPKINTDKKVHFDLS
jgi:hypothetical protein